MLVIVRVLSHCTVVFNSELHLCPVSGVPFLRQRLSSYPSLVALGKITAFAFGRCFGLFGFA